MAESEHWYDLEGNSRHVQEDGKQTTLRHARKQGLVPSVTKLISMLHSFQLERWKIMQAIEAATDGTKYESNEAILEASRERVKLAAEWGSELHLLFSNWLKFQKVGRSKVKEVRIAFKNLRIWWNQSGFDLIHSEKTFAYLDRTSSFKTGYGGTLDLLFTNKEGELVLADIKTKDGIPSQDYDALFMQLAAYSRHVWHDRKWPERWMVIYVDRKTGEILPKYLKVGLQDMIAYEEMFKCLLKYWWLDATRKGDYAI